MDNTYRIITDSSCDLTPELVEELNLVVAPMSVSIKGETVWNTPGSIDLHAFYDELRKATPAKTAAVNVQTFMDTMRPVLAEGEDILYLCFSSGLSATISAANTAREDLLAEFPDRRIEIVDSLCASMGQGLFVYLCAKKKEEGGTLDEVKQYAEDIKLHICHWFTVDDLHHLRRGGRLNPAVAILGTALQIKPIMYVSDEGKLEVVYKTHGRKSSIRELARMTAEHIEDGENQVIFISHGDCPEEAQQLADLAEKMIHPRQIIVGPIGPVIGVHSGPGTLAIFCVGETRLKKEVAKK